MMTIKWQCSFILARKVWTQGTLLAIMLDQLRPLQGTSYELRRLREKVTPDNISLIPHSSPIMTCGIPLPSDIINSGYGTSSHEVKVLWCLILFLINVYNILAYAAATFPQTGTKCRRVGPLECYWCGWSYLCRLSTLLWDFLSWQYIISNLIGFAALTSSPMLWPEPALGDLSSRRLTPAGALTPGCSWAQRPARLLLNGEKRELSCRNRVITVHGVTFSN